MLFLIDYDRGKGQIVSLRQFDDIQKREAENERLNLELDLNRQGLKHEVVLLDAGSERALRRTHRRYFENLEELLTPS